MGIKELWTILGPFCERKPLYELENKKIAIDLSCWVCEAQNIAEYQVQPRMYLRNLYFRTCCLLLMNVNPVFVLEGKAPELKYKTIAARNAIQFKGAKPKTDGVKTGKDRTRFHHTLKQCEEMLKYMGLACVVGDGEAEAFCAYLNNENLVDGIISQDSDCFAYGAKIVYRNFSISQQGANAAKGGSVDVYDIAVANKNLNFGRNKIIALALLCGSDYSEGVHGVGKDSVLKLFSRVSDCEILQRLRSWRNQDSLYHEFEAKISDKNLCTSCGHSGKLQSHTKKGCFECKTSSGCDFTRFKNERLEIKNELNMRSKALADPDFPNEELIDEYLKKNSRKLTYLDLKWKKPDIVNFIKFTVKYLGWEEIYSFEKFLPILTRWQLLNYELIAKSDLDGIVTPVTIKKRRKPKAVPCYEIIWEDKSNKIFSLIPEEQFQSEDKEKLFSTIEPQEFVEKAHPSLVEDFENSKKKPKKRSKKADVQKINDMLENISISEPVIKKTRTKAKKKPQNTLDSFLQLHAMKSSTPQKKIECSFDLNLSNFGDEDDLEVSDIVDNIINKKPGYVAENLEKMGLKLENLDNTCSFFITEPLENDLFEKTFNELRGESDCDENSD